MRLISTKTLQTHMFTDGTRIPQYATLSHCRETGEFLFGSGKLNSESSTAGLRKINLACRVARYLGIEWLWADTLCIDQSSSAELSEAVNASYGWYRDCQVCIVYLHDVDLREEPIGDIQAKLRRCRWIQRAWTLQELIAPTWIQFYDSQWSLIGSKNSLRAELSSVTGVDQIVLEDEKYIRDISIGRKMSWAASRSALHTEDIAYSLLGIMGVNMQVIYGEGPRAFTRLQEEILKDTDDASLFAWQSSNTQKYRGLFAKSPSEFSHFAHQKVTAPLRVLGDIILTCAGITINGAIHTQNTGPEIILDLCAKNSLNGSTLAYFGISIREWNGIFVRCAPHLAPHLAPHRPDSARRTSRSICVKRDVDPRTSDIIAKEVARTEDQNNFLCRTLIKTAERGRIGQSLVHPLSVSQNQSRFAEPAALDQFFFANNTEVESNHFVLSSPGPKPNNDGEVLQEASSYHGAGRHHQPQGTGHSGATVHERCSSNDNPGSPLKSLEEPSTVMHHDSASDYYHSDSSDDDSAIFASPAPEHPKLDPAHPFVKIVCDLAKHSLAWFSSYMVEERSRTRKRAKRTNFSPSRKRRRSTSETYTEVEQLTNSENEEPVLVEPHRVQRPRIFACPYYLQNPQAHQDCLVHALLRDIKDVKQHLWDKHRRPYYCPTCREVFATEAIRNSHIIGRSCPLRDTPNIEGVSRAQFKRLAKRSNLMKSAKGQWFAIWDIIFPEAQQPENPYFSGDIESTVCNVRDYWMRNGKRVIMEFLEENAKMEYGSAQTQIQDIDGLFWKVLEQMTREIATGSWKHEDGAAKQRAGVLHN